MVVGIVGASLLLLGLFLPIVSAPLGINVSLVGMVIAAAPGLELYRGGSLSGPQVIMATLAALAASIVMGFAESLARPRRYTFVPGGLALVAVGGFSIYMFQPVSRLPHIDPVGAVLVGPGWGLGVLVLGGILLVVASALPK